ncbi:hypothetical protein [Streptomyces sp. NPDC014006]|uniref:hypothetical protein n=1 Tax=Streptomyces sp. NPDC014006 TaxID=3364870 RepID=UPI0036FEEC27
MADEQYRWLDRETAERLLRGEPPATVPPDAREQAERLARALGALSAVPEKADTGLAGEDAAVAAFRAARTAHTGDAVRVPDNGVVRLGAGHPPGRRARWSRPLRLALCAVVAVGTVGGVAVAAGTGVLPTFGGAEPDPRVSVSADATAEHPQATPSPDGTASAGTAAGSGTARDGDRDTAGDPDSADGRGADAARRRITEACKDLRGGRALDGDRRRALETAAGGAPRVGAYCRTVLAAPGSGQDGAGHTRGGGGRGSTGAGTGSSGKGGSHGATAGGTGDAGQGGKGAGGQTGGQTVGQGGDKGGDQGGGAGGHSGGAKAGGEDGGQGGDGGGHGGSGGHGHGPSGGQGHGHGPSGSPGQGRSGHVTTPSNAL